MNAAPSASGARDLRFAASSVSPHETDVPPVTATRAPDESLSAGAPEMRVAT